MTPRDLAADVRAAVDEALQRRIDAAARRRQARRADRAARAAARAHGLAKRHARKAALIANDSQEETP